MGRWVQKNSARKKMPSPKKCRANEARRSLPIADDRLSPSRGETTGGGKPNCTLQHMPPTPWIWPFGTAAAPFEPHVCHARGCATNPRGSITPALRLADEEVAEGLHAGDRLELLRVNEIGIEREGFLFAEQLHQPAVFLDDVIRQHGDAEARLACPQDADDVVDHQMRRAR